jgi:hypothetical protein
MVGAADDDDDDEDDNEEGKGSKQKTKSMMPEEGLVITGKAMFPTPSSFSSSSHSSTMQKPALSSSAFKRQDLRHSEDSANNSARIDDRRVKFNTDCQQPSMFLLADPADLFNAGSAGENASSFLGSRSSSQLLTAVMPADANVRRNKKKHVA